MPNPTPRAERRTRPCGHPAGVRDVGDGSDPCMACMMEEAEDNPFRAERNAPHEYRLNMEARWTAVRPPPYVVVTDPDLVLAPAPPEKRRSWLARVWRAIYRMLQPGGFNV